MTPIVTLAVLLTVIALLIKRSSLVLAAAAVIVGGELLAISEWFSIPSTIVLAGCAQLSLYVALTTFWQRAIKKSKRLQLFTNLTLVCAVLSVSKLLGFIAISDAVVHDGFQEYLESFLAGSTITMAFLLLLSPTDKVPLHELGRNYLHSFFDASRHTHHRHHGGK